MQYNRRSTLSVHVRRSVRRERVITNRVACTLYAGLMPQRQAITMIIVYCSKPQQTDAVTPTPLVHRIHTCMRALALGHDTPPQGSRGAGPTSTRWSLSLISDNEGPASTFVKPSADMCLVPIQSTTISSIAAESLNSRCGTRMFLERSLEIVLSLTSTELLLSPHSDGVGA